MKTLLILLIISFNLYSQKKASFIATFGNNSGIGTTINLYTPDRSGIYLEYQRKYLESEILNLKIQNYAFGITFPTNNKKVNIGTGIGIMKRELNISNFKNIPIQYNIMLNTNYTYNYKLLIVKAGAIINPKIFTTAEGEIWINCGIGICL